jgi:hypothetical protein
MHTAASILTKATRDVERLAQLQDDSVAARDLAASIRQHVADWERLPSLSVPDLQRLVDAKVRWAHCWTGPSGSWGCSHISPAVCTSAGHFAAGHNMQPHRTGHTQVAGSLCSPLHADCILEGGSTTP